MFDRPADPLPDSSMASGLNSDTHKESAKQIFTWIILCARNAPLPQSNREQEDDISV